MRTSFSSNLQHLNDAFESEVAFENDSGEESELADSVVFDSDAEDNPLEDIDIDMDTRTVAEEFGRVFGSPKQESAFNALLEEKNFDVNVFVAVPQRQFDDETCPAHTTHDIVQFFREENYFQHLEAMDQNPEIVSRHPNDPKLFMVHLLRPEDMKLLQSKTALAIYRENKKYQDLEKMEQSIKKSNRIMSHENTKEMNAKAIYRLMKLITIIKDYVKTQSTSQLAELAKSRDASKLSDEV